MNVQDILQRLIKYSPMSVYEDLGIVSDILTFIQPKYILELGAGGGGWILSINDALKSDITYLGYETFEVTYDGYDWFLNEKDLTEYLRREANNKNITIKNENVKSIDLEYIKTLGISFDVIRLDCLDNIQDINTLFYKLYPYTSDNCIFLVDDIVPNLCPNRFLAYMDKVYENILQPVWFGNKEGAWCKSSYNIDQLQDYICKQMKNKIRGIKDTVIWYNKQYTLVLSYGGYSIEQN